MHFSRVFFSHDEEERAGLRCGWDLDSDRVLGISVFGNPIRDVTQCGEEHDLRQGVYHTDDEQVVRLVVVKLRGFHPYQ